MPDAKPLVNRRSDGQRCRDGTACGACDTWHPRAALPAPGGIASPPHRARGSTETLTAGHFVLD